MRRVVFAILVLALSLPASSVIFATEAEYFPRASEEIYVPTENEYESEPDGVYDSYKEYKDKYDKEDHEEDDEYYYPPLDGKYEEELIALEVMYESIMPLSTILVADWDAFLAAIGNPFYDTIVLEANITAGGAAPSITRNITVTSADTPGVPFTITQTNTGQRHFIIQQGTLTLNNIILCGGSIAINSGGIEFSTANNFQHLYLGAGSVIENNHAPQGGGVFMRGSNASSTINGGIIRNNEAVNGGGVSVTSNSTLTMLDGAVENNTAATQGGGVQVAIATFNMVYGIIYGNEANSGGGVFMSNAASTMTMQGGYIVNNEAAVYGGGVSVTASSSFIMEDGVISDNHANHGGGVNIVNPAGASTFSSFEMLGGQIKDNVATNDGGGVRVQSGGTFDMSGNSTIHNNEANNGAGVHVMGTGNFAPSTFRIHSGEIYNNIAFNNGGGVNIATNARFIMIDGDIRENEVGNNGGGVNMVSGTFTMQGGIIQDHFANNGGGVNISGGIFDMEGGIIQNNSAMGDGGGVWLASGSDAAFSMTDGIIRNNRAYGGNGGGLFAHNPSFSDPMNALAYPRILSIGLDAVFSGNWAASGAFRPSCNIVAIRDRIQTESATLFGHPINNYDINFDNFDVVLYLTIRYRIDTPERGTFALPDEFLREEEVALDPDSYPFFPQNIPGVTAHPGYRFIGWIVDGWGLENEPISCTELANFQITDDITFIAQFEPILYEVRFNLNGGVGDSTTRTDVTWGQTNLLPPPPTRAGWTFIGWNVIVGGNRTNVTNADAYSVLANNNPNTPYVVLQAQWVQNQNGGNNNGGNGNGNETPGNGGDGRGNWWSGAQPPRPTVPRNGVAPDTEPSDTVRTHYLYVIGYPDGNFRPDAFITRAEVAAIAARISIGEFGNFTREAMYPANFLDIAGDEWFANYIGFAQQNDLLRGYPSSNFEPHWNMTRAEFAAMMARLRGLSPSGTSAFPDVGNHWATGYINILTVSVPGAIIGYEDGTFRPDAFITRAEAVKIVNYVLNRGIDVEGLRDVTYRNFPDIIGHWAYFEIIEASNTHTFVATAYDERWLSARWDVWWR